MLAFELGKRGEVFGIGKENEIEKIEKRELFVKRNDRIFLFEGRLIKENEFPGGVSFDVLFLTTKNPIENVLFYYYQKIRELRLTPPVLFLSQNGIEAGEVAISVLKKIFGKEAEKISVFRLLLFNPVDKMIENEKTFISYSLPIRLAVSKIFGKNEFSLEILKEKNLEIFNLSPQRTKDAEYSKLFLNLIGMASATHGLSIKEGFSKKEVFEEEIKAIKEYKKLVKMKKGKFLNFPHYPVAFLSFIFSLPVFLLTPFRKIFGDLIERGRKGKRKELDEIEYYNGAVVKLGEKLKVGTPINFQILERAKKCQKKF